MIVISAFPIPIFLRVLYIFLVSAQLCLCLLGSRSYRLSLFSSRLKEAYQFCTVIVEVLLVTNPQRLVSRHKPDSVHIHYSWFFLKNSLWFDCANAMPRYRGRKYPHGCRASGRLILVVIQPKLYPPREYAAPRDELVLLVVCNNTQDFGETTTHRHCTLAL